MVSVIIPTYNRGSLIGRAIVSVLNQTYKDIEVLVIDDASTDYTETVVDSIKDERLHYYKLEKNGGACRARNVGISKAQGEYIAFLDSDDEWMSNKIELQYKEYTYLGIVGEKNEKSRYAIEQRNKFSVGEEIEVMKPDGENVCVTVKGIWDEEGNQMESAPHPKQKLWIDLGVELDRFDILRRKEME